MRRSARRRRPGRLAVVLVHVEHVGVDVADVQERGALQPDVDERRLHAREHAHDAPQVDVTDEPARVPTVDVEFDELAVLHQRDTDLATRRADDDLGGQRGLRLAHAGDPGSGVFERSSPATPATGAKKVGNDGSDRQGTSRTGGREEN